MPRDDIIYHAVVGTVKRRSVDVTYYEVGCTGAGSGIHGKHPYPHPESINSVPTQERRHFKRQSVACDVAQRQS